MNRKELVDAIGSYSTPYPKEEIFIARFLGLLEHPRCYFRDHLPGHITGSTWIIDTEKQLVLLTHHAKLKKWLQPGGHADGDENILQVALKEAKEETGIQNFLSPSSFFDIDIHPIPARGDFPEHDHYDIRFLLIADSSQPLVISSESKDLKWIKWEELNEYTNTNASITRMLEKTEAIYRVSY